MTDRRSFLARLAASVAGLGLAKQLPAAEPSKSFAEIPLVGHPDPERFTKGTWTPPPYSEPGPRATTQGASGPHVWQDYRVRLNGEPVPDCISFQVACDYERDGFGIHSGLFYELGGHGTVTTFFWLGRDFDQYLVRGGNLDTGSSHLWQFTYRGFVHVEWVGSRKPLTSAAARWLGKP